MKITNKNKVGQESHKNIRTGRICHTEFQARAEGHIFIQNGIKQSLFFAGVADSGIKKNGARKYPHERKQEPNPVHKSKRNIKIASQNTKSMDFPSQIKNRADLKSQIGENMLFLFTNS